MLLYNTGSQPKRIEWFSGGHALHRNDATTACSNVITVDQMVRNAPLEESMALPFVEENATSRRRLETLIRRLSDADLVRSTPYGWTVAALLAHMAFWDQRVLVLLHRWKAKGVDASPIDSEAVNDALKPLCLALDPRQAIDLCLSSAAAVDAELETITADLMEQVQEEVQANRMQFRFSRALHRNAHLDDIEALLRPS